MRDAMGRYASMFDASFLSTEQAAGAVALASSIEKMAATVKGLVAARAAGGGGWKGTGDRSAAHHLARTTGTSVGQATEAIETAQRLEKLPVLAAAARAGELSPQQAAAVADAASVDTSAEAALVATARTSSLGELREHCARTKAAARPDAEARRKAIHAERYLRSWADTEGAWNLKMRDNPEVGAEVMAAIDAIRDRLFKAARAEGREEPSEAYAADALAELARTGGAGEGARRSSSRAKIIVRVDLAALLRGQVRAGEVCELAGFGPVAASAVRDLIDTGDPFLAAVVTKGEQVVGVAHLGRRANTLQQTALEWLYPTCAAEGCSSVTWLENDHRADWATTHHTVLDLLDRLCTHHHDLKSLDGWGLVEGRGKRPFVPPDDPRHPRHRPAATSAA
ncbi:MAG: 13E12 repeat family protein [Actinomycetota bacterium]|nr:13E12 repeat family protein [Actinomycetota bacterium]